MMREIKFKAWHIGLKQMIPAEEMAADQMTLLPTGQFINVSGTSTKLSQINTQMLPLQYTGLKDKNGVDIYEGDVLSAPASMSYRFGDNGEVRYESEYGSFIVEGKYSKNQHYETLTCDVAIDCEVIGNIYENRELLNS